MNEDSELYMSGFYKEDIPVICEEADLCGLVLETYTEKNRWVGTKFVKKGNI